MMDIEDQVRGVVRDTPGPDAIPAWETVTTRGRRIRGRRRIGRATLALGVVGAVVLGIVYVTGSGDTSSRSIVANPAPGDATVTTSADASVIPPGQYRYVRIAGMRTGQVSTSHNDVSIALSFPTTAEFWTGADSSGRVRTTDREGDFLTPENAQALADLGETVDRAPHNNDAQMKPGEMRRVDVSSLPQDPAAVRAWFSSTEPSSSMYAANVLEGVSDSMWYWEGPAESRRALVSILSSTPGMQVESKEGETVISAEALGRRTEISFDETGQPRRVRKIMVDATFAPGMHAPNGTVLLDYSLDTIAIVPSVDSVPGKS
jgi:hypothetical protein